MSEHKATIEWKRETESFAYEDYSRDHTWRFENDSTVAASAATRFLGNPERVDPEAAFVASLSSCHMLTFIAICAREGIIVDSYTDDAVGFLEVKDRKLRLPRVILRPRIAFAPGHEPDAEKLAELHHRSHADCFIANSVTTEITVE